MQSPPAYAARAVPAGKMAALDSLDLKLPIDSTWHLVPQPAAINLNAAATLGDAVK